MISVTTRRRPVGGAPGPARRQISITTFVLVCLGICHRACISDAFSSSPFNTATIIGRNNAATINGEDIIASSLSLSSKKGEVECDGRAADTDTDTTTTTVQILMSDTGGGHRASGEAVKDALEYLHPGKFECDIVDIYTEYGPFWPYNDYVRMYKVAADNPWTWDIFYRFGETDFGLKLNEFCLNLFCYQPFRRCMEERTFASTQKRADIIVSVHPLCQDLPIKILADLDNNDPSKKTKTPFVTVVTDLGGAHKTWFNQGVDKCFVPSDALNKKAQSRGLDPSSQICQYGLPIRKQFFENTTGTDTTDVKYRMRQKLQLKNDIPTVLVVGGGGGMGGIAEIASTLGDSLGRSTVEKNRYQMVVVCGSNQNAQHQLEQKDWPHGITVHIKGFVNNMDEWMKASDCIVTKAGPGTIAEASICGLPCLLFAYLPGQEEGNVSFVEEAGFGTYTNEPYQIAETVKSWLESSNKLESMKRAAIAVARPHATLDIAQELAYIAFTATAANGNKKDKLTPLVDDEKLLSLR